MLKKLAVFGLAVIVVAMIGLPVWANAVLGGDTVRAAIAAQISKALGQPVTIGSLSAGVYPRVTLTLGDVQIGEAGRLRVSSLALGTDVRALLSRRVEHASVRLSGARIELPLPAFTTGGGSSAPASGPSPVELVSIDEIVLSDVEIVSGGRTVRGDLELIPEGNGLAIRRMTIGAGDTTVHASGRITDLAGPKGEIALKAGLLNFDQLIAFATDFSGGASPTAGGEARPRQAAAPVASDPAGKSGLDLIVSLEADRAMMGTLALDKLSGRAHLTAASIALDPIAFGVFGGRFEGSLTLAADQETPGFRTKAMLTGIDVAAAMRFAGSPDTISGRLTGRLDLAGRGSDPAAIARSAKGTARLEISDGVVKNLGLVRAVVVATSMRSGSTGALTSDSKDEPFSKLGATLNIAGGTATTGDLSFEAKHLSLSAQGVVQMNASTMNLKGNIQLSDALSQQAGRDLVRYTQDQGRVTLPATVDGSLDSPHVGIDVGNMAKRAAVNAATEQIQKRLKTDALGKTLSGLFKK